MTTRPSSTTPAVELIPDHRNTNIAGESAAGRIGHAAG